MPGITLLIQSASKIFTIIRCPFDIRYGHESPFCVFLSVSNQVDWLTFFSFSKSILLGSFLSASFPFFSRGVFYWLPCNLTYLYITCPNDFDCILFMCLIRSKFQLYIIPLYFPCGQDYILHLSRKPQPSFCFIFFLISKFYKHRIIILTLYRPVMLPFLHCI